VEIFVMTARHYGVSACILAILLLGLSMFGGRAVMGAGAAPHVAEPWVRMSAVAGRPAGGYFLVHGTGTADALVGVSSPMAERIELHSMVNENGVMKMRAQASFAVPAKGELKFAPGGNHLMIYGLSPQVKAGGAMPITLSFKSGAKVDVKAAVRAAADAAPQKADTAHQH
jgi:copper(I)-binding protein